MDRKIWCYACAASRRLTEDDRRTEWRTVRWGFVSRPNLTCDECGCDLPGGAFAACVTHHRGSCEYRPWEGRFVIPREVHEEDLEQEPNPEIRGYLARFREIQAFDRGHCHDGAVSESSTPSGDAEGRLTLGLSLALFAASGVLLGLACLGG